jgi:hypothetical protein
LYGYNPIVYRLIYFLEWRKKMSDDLRSEFEDEEEICEEYDDEIEDDDYEDEEE